MSDYCDNAHRPIYKYIRFKYIQKMLKNRTIFVSKITKWEDVYENFFLKQKFCTECGMEISQELLSDCFPGIFGQSWTLQKSSDAMWRIYSQIAEGSDLDDTAVRIETTPQKLLTQIGQYNSEGTLGLLLKAVEYKSSEEIDEWLTKIQPITKNNMADLIIKSLFIKRLDFQHEKEVRLIAHKKNDDKSSRHDYFESVIDPFFMISEYVVDPRVDDVKYEQMKNLLVQLGVEAQRIRKSQLYKLNKRTLVVDAKEYNKERPHGGIFPLWN